MMKMPSLDTAEGMIVLGAGALLAYALYRSYTVGTSIATNVASTISSAGTSVQNIVSDIIPKSSEEQAANQMLNSDPLSPANVQAALDARPIDMGVGGSSWDGTASPQAQGIGTTTSQGSLGTDTHTIATPQSFSPDPIGTNDGSIVASYGMQP